MDRGETVVLMQQEDLYESLYDMLNQHYIDFNGKKLCRLALGPNSKLCAVHEKFKCIVIADRDLAERPKDGKSRLPAPMLNRFEKQLLLRQEMIIPARFESSVGAQQVDLHREVKLLQTWAESLRIPGSRSDLLESIIVGYHPDLIFSLVLQLRDYTATVRIPSFSD